MMPSPDDTAREFLRDFLATRLDIDIDMFDFLTVAHPTASDDEVEKMIDEATPLVEDYLDELRRMLGDG